MSAGTHCCIRLPAKAPRVGSQTDHPTIGDASVLTNYPSSPGERLDENGTRSRVIRRHKIVSMKFMFK
jgi:hypothetical protein